MERKNAFFAKTTAFRAKSGVKSICGFGAAFGRRANAGAIFNRARLSTMGDSVTAINGEEGKITKLTPDFVMANNKKSLWRRIVDYFKNLLGVNTERKMESMQQQADKDAAEFASHGAYLRESITLDQLTGKSAAKKLETATRQLAQEKENSREI